MLPVFVPLEIWTGMFNGTVGKRQEMPRKNLPDSVREDLKGL